MTENEKLSKSNELTLNSTTAKQYLEEIYEHKNTFGMNQTMKTRKFALKKNQLKDFITSSQKFDLGQINDTDTNQDSALKEDEEKTKQEFVPNILLDKIPSFELEPISVVKLKYPRSDGINRLDRATQHLMNDMDELDSSLSSLQMTLQSIETACTNCEHSARLNSVMSSSGLRQLTQIHDNHSNSNFFTFIWNKILDWVL
ncbi:hypothetical protein TVAG_050780 [Trichomonas vaginalis G3]|uniref:Uncharacterized protein n=1 Tax=Trichomonas vaginalis (strain ATCC PRA-98 / G3) TaxID=412133 RepID=A2EEN8_TRIV3|nr:hypothetical protein TVAGG3_0981620 [Trichomonas vaginalis G3]EAY08844.1 hypothetical protein TVAG_050780 [Trichomonas vaginalis G3]KAI5489339.1 hypothetical protein TVAGG3_0981620 [Trichomonas vaginalis G3]|eukprot:XP_001321067.1 hypothetical protein [Trichomonas vaginalis G3]